MMRNMRIGAGTILIILVFLAVQGMSQIRMQQRRAMGQATVHAVAGDVIQVSGQVTRVIMAAGQGMPSITMRTATGDVTVMLGPYRLLAEIGIEIKEGQLLDLKAFPDLRIANAYVAKEIKDPSGAWVALRDDAGMPLMGSGAMVMGRGRGGMGRGMMAGSGNQGGVRTRQGAGICAQDHFNVDFSARTAITGTVGSVDMAPGQGLPTFTIIAGGKAATIVASPYQALVRAGFEISEGDTITVLGYPLVNASDTYLAAELQIGQNVLKLRDENGAPLFSGGRGRMMGIRR